ncbi:hypothetical protein [Paenibacillus sp. GbtcB18]|uniref:hypothetical protein n=1 Tax=Paenibacillus sp. GbtcB18 TaxID=2824763 RepID=UPI001C2FFCFD|nr:hypothetical protein [Paenibacillus sp. GbtcB18]
MKKKLLSSFFALCLTTTSAASFAFALPAKDSDTFRNYQPNQYAVSKIISGRDAYGKVGVLLWEGNTGVHGTVWERCGKPDWFEKKTLYHGITLPSSDGEASIYMNSSCEYKLTLDAGGNTGQGFIRNY